MRAARSRLRQTGPIQIWQKSASRFKRAFEIDEWRNTASLGRHNAAAISQRHSPQIAPTHCFVWVIPKSGQR
jgi:hypothetical protein